MYYYICIYIYIYSYFYIVWSSGRIKKQVVQKPSIHKNFKEFHPIFILKRKTMQTLFFYVFIK